MTGDKIPENHHIARLCKPKTFNEDGQITGSAFILDQGHRSLSINWLECLNCSKRSDEIIVLQVIYLSKLKKVPTNAKIAVLNVGQVRLKVLTESSDRRDLAALHEPEDIDYSHSGIYNLRYNEVEIAELILQTIQEEHPAKRP